MATNEETNAAGTDTRPPMLVESDYESWKIRIHRWTHQDCQQPSVAIGEQSTVLLIHWAYVAPHIYTALHHPQLIDPQPYLKFRNDALMATMTQIANLLSGFQKQFPPTNNQLRTSSNTRTHATVHDGQIVTEPVQRKAPGNNGNTGPNDVVAFHGHLSSHLCSNIPVDPFHQYLLDTEAQNVPTEVSADTSDKILYQGNRMIAPRTSRLTSNPGLGYIAKRAQPVLYDDGLPFAHPAIIHPVSIWDSEEVPTEDSSVLKRQTKKDGKPIKESLEKPISKPVANSKPQWKPTGRHFSLFEKTQAHTDFSVGQFCYGGVEVAFLSAFIVYIRILRYGGSTQSSNVPMGEAVATACYILIDILIDGRKRLPTSKRPEPLVVPPTKKWEDDIV
ncbi:hypothetical protein Tco_0854514 [Tanacetum coccineum]